MPEHPDLQDEQEFLDRAYDGLEFMRGEARQMLEGVLDLGRGGTFQSRTERDIVVRTSLARLEQLDIGDQALYFGRIDRLPEPAPDDGPADGALGESFHIGRLAVSGPDHEPLVVDWRAPVAEPFYRATGLDPQGLARRRHLAVRGRQVVGLEDEYFVDPSGQPAAPAPASDGAAGHDGDAGGERLLSDGLVLGGPGALLSALGQARTGHMGDIIGTIQREQDEIIRSPLGGVLVVQGGPGTGKTAVALHRAAYLLYTHRFPLERQGVLVVGPNPLFLRYIEQVLPSLGETGVSLSTVAGLVPEVRVRGVDDAAVAKLKGDARMVKVLARAVRSRERPLRRDADVPFGASVLRLRAAATEDIVTLARRRPGTHNARRRFVEAQVLRALADDYRARLARTGADLGEEAPSQEEQDDLAQRLRRVPEVAEALDRMWPRLSPHEFLHDLLGARPLLAVAGKGILSADEIKRLYRPRGAALEAVPWTVADAALVDEARTLLGSRRGGRPNRARAQRTDEALAQEFGFWPQGLAQSPLPVGAGLVAAEDDIRSFGHIVVDEVQDLSPMQLRMLARRSLSGSMTVVGDIAQATGPWAPTSWDDITRHLSPQRAPAWWSSRSATAPPPRWWPWPRGCWPSPPRRSRRRARCASPGSRPALWRRPEPGCRAPWPRWRARRWRPSRPAMSPSSARPSCSPSWSGPWSTPVSTPSTRATPRATAWGPGWWSCPPTRPTAWSSTRSLWSSRRWWPRWATNPPARARRCPRRGACARSTWPSPDPPGGWPSCTPSRFPSTSVDLGVLPGCRGGAPPPAFWHFRAPVD